MDPEQDHSREYLVMPQAPESIFIILLAHTSWSTVYSLAGQSAIHAELIGGTGWTVQTNKICSRQDKFFFTEEIARPISWGQDFTPYLLVPVLKLNHLAKV